TAAAAAKSSAVPAPAPAKVQTNAAASSAISATDPIQAFHQWCETYVNAAPADRAALTAEGLALAQARRPAFKQLIQDNPRAAVEQMVSLRVRQQLPAEVKELLEERLNGR